VEPLADPHDLFDGLAGAEDDLGLALPQAAVVVDRGERKVLGRKMAEPLEGIGRRDAPRGDLGEKPLQVGAVHATCAIGAR
jgi:hypothetical protein